MLGKHPGVDVGRPPCAERNDHFDRMVRITLCGRRPGQQNRQRQCGKPQKHAHQSSPFSLFPLRKSYVPPADLKPGARSAAAANAPLASTAVKATVVRKSVTPPLLPAASSAAAICTSFGASATVRKSYSPNVR